jgi:peptidoglycan L-alanyl-D-glutamate endopeptidase CwlK
MHNYGLAIDSVPMRSGKPVWDSKKPEDLTLWQLYGRLSVEAGFEWAGNWKKFREFPHIQEPGAGWKDLIRQ